MPPKVKYSRDQILSAALDITRERGIENVTARELGSRLGSSSRPIFTAFENMEEVHAEVTAAAKKIFYQYVGDFQNYTPAFKRFGTQMIRFSIEEPKLFMLLFMRENSREADIKDAIMELHDNPDEIVSVIMRDYQLDEEMSWKLLSHLVIFSYGISALCARQICTFSEEEIDVMLGEEFAGIISLYKSGRYRFCGVHADVGRLVEGHEVGNLPFVEDNDIE